MTLFWVLAAIMVALSMVFVLLPFFRRSDNSDSTDQDTLNIAVIKQQIAELEADMQSGKLESSKYEAARTDLEKELLYDLSSTHDGQAVLPSTNTRSGRWLTLLLIIAVPVSSVFLYRQIGSAQIIAQLDSPPSDTSAATQQDNLPSVEEMVGQLAERLLKDPENLEGWMMLGRSYAVLQRWDDAANTYARANELANGKDPDVLTNYAESLAFANDGRMEGKPAEMLKTALEIQPQNPHALWLSGYMSFQRQDFAQAVKQWRSLVDVLPKDSGQIQQIEQNILEAQAQLTSNPESEAQTAIEPAKTDSASPEKSVQVQVSLAENLAGQTQPEDTVFIFARAMSGPRMPLAIVRKQVKDLPTMVKLDDSTAMSAATVISKFDQVMVGARVSKSGNAMPQSGDFEGSQNNIKPGQIDAIQLSIDRAIP